MIKVIPVGPDMLDDAVNVMSGQIARLLKRNSAGFHPVNVMNRLHDGHIAMWIICVDDKPKGVAFTQVEDWVEGRVLRLLAVAGDGMRGWFWPWITEMKAYGRSEDCAKMVGEGRRGWSRAMGLKPIREVFEMDTKS